LNRYPVIIVDDAAEHFALLHGSTPCWLTTR
jgi:hypothetical protein